MSKFWVYLTFKRAQGKQLILVIWNKSGLFEVDYFKLSSNTFVTTRSKALQQCLKKQKQSKRKFKSDAAVGRNHFLNLSDAD